MPTDEQVPEVSDPADLYSLPLDRFTAARDTLAGWLRSQNRNDEAETVAKLRKPSLPAWALNRASRNNPDLVQRLREGHRLLRQAHSGEEMHSASKERRHAVSALLEAALGELRSDGRSDSPQTRDRINSTLLALATDTEGESQLEEGRLTHELKPSGAGWGEMGLTPTPVDPRQDAVAEAERARARANRLDRDAAEAERRLEVAEQAVKEARRKAKAARAQFEEASSEATRAEEAAAENAPKE